MGRVSHADGGCRSRSDAPGSHGRDGAERRRGRSVRHGSVPVLRPTALAKGGACGSMCVVAAGGHSLGEAGFPLCGFATVRDGARWCKVERGEAVRDGSRRGGGGDGVPASAARSVRGGCSSRGYSNRGAGLRSIASDDPWRTIPSAAVSAAAGYPLPAPSGTFVGARPFSRRFSGRAFARLRN